MLLMNYNIWINVLLICILKYIKSPLLRKIGDVDFSWTPAWARTARTLSATTQLGSSKRKRVAVLVCLFTEEAGPMASFNLQASRSASSLVLTVRVTPPTLIHLAYLMSSPSELRSTSAAIRHMSPASEAPFSAG